MEKLAPIDYSSQVEKEKFVAKLIRSEEVLQDLQMAHRHTLLAAPNTGGNFPLMLARSASGMWAAVTIEQLQGMAIRIETLSINLQAHQAHHRSRRYTPMRFNRGEGRLNHAEALEPEAEDGYGSSAAVLYQRLAQQGRVKWTPAQLNKLRDENRCFFCGQRGHERRDCPSKQPANPETFVLHHAEYGQLDETEEVAADEDMLARLEDLSVEFDSTKNGSSSRQ